MHENSTEKENSEMSKRRDSLFLYESFLSIEYKSENNE